MAASAGHVLIIDDHPIVLYGLRFLFEGHDRFSVCGEAGDPETACVLARELRPEFIVLDLALGGRDGIDLIRDLASACPETRILVYSSQNEWRFARQALQSGAKGYVAKSEGLPVVEEAIGVLARGETFVSAGLQRKLLENFLDLDRSFDRDPVEQLSGRELQVLRMIGGGAATSAIAEALNVSTKTIATYRDRMKLKLGVTSLRALEEVARSYALKP